MSDRSLANLTVLSVALAVGELISAAIIAVQNYPGSFWPAAVVIGLLFLVGTWLLRSGRVTAGAGLVAFLCLVELVTFPTFVRLNAFDWIYQSAYALLSLVGLAASIVVLVARRRSHGGVAGSSRSGTADPA